MTGYHPPVSEWPVAALYAFLFAGAMVRANATYWLGRGARHKGEDSRAARYLSNPVVRRAETLVARFGAPLVSLSFLTVGVQTAVNLAAGVLRMPLWRYEIAAVVGSLAWAAIYSTVGLAVLDAWWGQARPWVFAGVAGAVGLVWLSTWAARRRLDRTPPMAPEEIPGDSPELPGR